MVSPASAITSASVKSPYAIASIGEYRWYLGDGYLESVEVTAAEGSNSSSCRFSIYDPGRKYIDKFLEYIEEIGGLEPLEAPETAPPASSAPGGGSTASGGLSVNMQATLDLIGHAEGANYNTQFGGGTFSSYAQHPNQSNDLKPAGRYQFQFRTWKGIAAQLGLTDFSPQSQDKAAVGLIAGRNVTSDVEAGNIEAALTGTGGVTGLAWEWASLPPSRYGQTRLTMSEAIAYFNKQVAALAPSAQSQSAAVESVEQIGSKSASGSLKKEEKRASALAGSQITIELGFDGQAIAAFSYLHTALSFAAYDHDVLEFGGQAAVWVLTQRVKNSAYQNITLKELAQKVCDNYGLTLQMKVDGPRYEYFPQRGISDYQMLLIECRRIGYRMINRGSFLYIGAREFKDAFYLRPGENLGLDFNVDHQAQSGSDGGARSSDPSSRSTTGQRKVVIDPATGQLTQIHPENTTGATGSAATASPDLFTTGSDVPPIKPLTDKATDAQDLARQRNEKRVKGIMATWSAPTTPEMLLIDPDTTIVTEGLSPVLDRVWVCESVTHSLSATDGFKTSGTLYSPLVNKYPTPEPAAVSSGSVGEPPPLNPNGFIKPNNGSLTSGFGPRGGRVHKGVDLAGGVGNPIWASADGVVSRTHTGCTVGDKLCGGSYGNHIYISHGDGFETRYAHLSKVLVTMGDQVTQGQKIGEEGNTGSSTGPHLHFEIRRNGTAENPAKHVSL